MAIRGRAPGCTKPAGSGRKPGQAVKTRTEITDAMRQDVWSSYRKLGGVKWLVAFAQSEQGAGVYVREVLARILPPIPREEPMVQVNTQINGLSDHEVAARIAFVLSKASHEAGLDPAPPTRTIEAVAEPAPVDTIPALPPSTEPEPANNPPVGETYRGSRLEQGLEPRSRNVVSKRRRSLL